MLLLATLNLRKYREAARKTTDDTNRRLVADALALAQMAPRIARRRRARENKRQLVELGSHAASGGASRRRTAGRRQSEGGARVAISSSEQNAGERSAPKPAIAAVSKSAAALNASRPSAVRASALTVNRH